MPEDHHLAGRFRFGVFEMDFRAGELRKHGLKIRIQEQPVQVLAMLVQRAGEVVTREELQKKLWPADTFVDFDHGLNKAINKIREALSDSSESPRFVETVQIRINLNPQEQAALKKVKLVNPEAYESYLKGRYFWNKRTADGLKVALAYFNQAIGGTRNTRQLILA